MNVLTGKDNLIRDGKNTSMQQLFNKNSLDLHYKKLKNDQNYEKSKIELKMLRFQERAKSAIIV